MLFMNELFGGTEMLGQLDLIIGYYTLLSHRADFKYYPDDMGVFFLLHWAPINSLWFNFLNRKDHVQNLDFSWPFN